MVVVDYIYIFTKISVVGLAFLSFVYYKNIKSVYFFYLILLLIFVLKIILLLVTWFSRLFFFRQFDEMRKDSKLKFGHTLFRFVL
jgi:hypothetical protein